MRLSDDFFSFVAENRGVDPVVLRLRHHGDRRWWMPLALDHIEGLRKCGRKFVAEDGADFTPRVIARPLAVEQATSARIGMLHDRLAGNSRRVLDMTCGLGIDSRFLARGGRELTTIELNDALADAARFNFADMPNVNVVNADSIRWLAAYDGEPFDLVFIDPARRGDGTKRLYGISDCSPDVLSLLPLLKAKSERVMVKLSPMLDVTQTLRELPGVVRLHIVEERGDCRELLAVIDFTVPPAEPEIVVHDDNTELSLRLSEDAVAGDAYALPHPGMWLCEPGPAAMKSGAFSLLARRFGLSALHRDTHLFVGDKVPEGFPGKCRQIEAVYPLASSTLKAVGKNIGRADVAVRNLPRFTPELLARRLGVKSGGALRVVGCTVADGSKALIVVRKGTL